jgi:hypothetical protein
VIVAIRHGHKVTRRSALKVVLSSEFPRSASARVAEWRALMVRWSTVSVQIRTAGMVFTAPPPGSAARVDLSGGLQRELDDDPRPVAGAAGDLDRPAQGVYPVAQPDQT